MSKFIKKTINLKKSKCLPCTTLNKILDRILFTGSNGDPIKIATIRFKYLKKQNPQLAHKIFQYYNGNRLQFTIDEIKTIKNIVSNIGIKDTSKIFTDIKNGFKGHFTSDLGNTLGHSIRVGKQVGNFVGGNTMLATAGYAYSPETVSDFVTNGANVVPVVGTWLASKGATPIAKSIKAMDKGLGNVVGSTTGGIIGTPIGIMRYGYKIPQTIRKSYLNPIYQIPEQSFSKELLGSYQKGGMMQIIPQSTQKKIRQLKRNAKRFVNKKKKDFLDSFKSN